MRLLSSGFQVKKNILTWMVTISFRIRCVVTVMSATSSYVTDLFQDASKCSDYESLNDKKVREMWFAPDMKDSEGDLI